MKENISIKEIYIKDKNGIVKKLSDKEKLNYKITNKEFLLSIKTIRKNILKIFGETAV